MNNRIKNRFHSKYRVNPETGCWDWLGALDEDGYGHFSIAKLLRSAHRVSYEIHSGPIPSGLCIDHLCRNRGCVNPEHLEAVTARENTNRGRNANAEKTHCPNGHAYTKENTWTNGNVRLCRECGKRNAREYRAAKRAARYERFGTNYTLKDCCKNGHSYTPENTYIYRKYRMCKACRNINLAKFKERKRKT